jgi:protein-S-isoprenylcysteine O-methyltransferase Ste14
MTLKPADRYYRYRWAARGLWTMAVLLLIAGVYFILEGAYPRPGHGSPGHAAAVTLGTVLAGLSVLAALTAFYCVQRAKLLAREIRDHKAQTAPGG